MASFKSRISDAERAEGPSRKKLGDISSDASNGPESRLTLQTRLQFPKGTGSRGAKRKSGIVDEHVNPPIVQLRNGNGVTTIIP